jgi:hypothetical protein
MKVKNFWIPCKAELSSAKAGLIAVPSFRKESRVIFGLNGKGTLLRQKDISTREDQELTTEGS